MTMRASTCYYVKDLNHTNVFNFSIEYLRAKTRIEYNEANLNKFIHIVHLQIVLFVKNFLRQKYKIMTVSRQFNWWQRETPWSALAKCSNS